MYTRKYTRNYTPAVSQGNYVKGGRSRKEIMVIHLTTTSL